MLGQLCDHRDSRCNCVVNEAVSSSSSNSTSPNNGKQHLLHGALVKWVTLSLGKQAASE